MKLAIKAAALLAASFSGFALAQPLADHVPADAIAYVGFRGSKALAADYQSSHLRAVLESTDLDVLTSEQFHDQVANAIGRKNPDLGDAWPTLAGAAKAMWRYPIAYVVRQGKAGLSVAMICQAGPDAPQIAQSLLTLPTAQGMVTKQVGEYVLLSNEPAEFEASLKAGNSTLASVGQFRAAMQHVDAQGAIVIYWNLDAIKRLPQLSDPKSQRLFDSLGLQSIHSAAASGTFDQQRWRQKAFISCDPQRSGIVSLLDSKPLSDGVLKIVPRSAVHVSIGQLDLSRTLDEVRRVSDQMDPASTKQIDHYLEMGSALIGIDIRAQLLPVFGPEWVLYSDGSIGGSQWMGMVMANRLRDPAKAQEVLARLQHKLLTFARAGAQTKQMKIFAATRKVGATQINIIDLPILTPAWAIRDGVLYIGLYPQVVAAAADFTASGSPSIADIPDIQAWSKSTGRNPSSISYIDLKQASEGGYGTAMALSRYMGLADMLAGVQTPLMPLPPLSVLREHATPHVSMTWSDDAGWHYDQTGAFPGSGMLASTMSNDMSAAQGPVMVSILLPSLAKARESANQVKCASNMHQIELELMMYRTNHAGRFPKTLGELTHHGVSPEIFICPSGDSEVPLSIRNGKRADVEAWINNSSDYIYLGADLNERPAPGRAVLYEKNAHHRTGSNVLFVAGYVRFVPVDELEILIQQEP